MKILPLNRHGQAMLLTLLAIGGVLMGALTIAGTLVVYQIRQSGEAVYSAKAIFAADGAIEWGLYQFFKGEAPAPVFSNGALFTLTCPPSGDCASASTTIMKAIGTANNVARALELSL